jgi:hypothetical protein
MAYNNFYPQYYQPMPNQAFQQNYQQNQAFQQQPQNYQQQNMAQNMPQNQPQIQNGGFMQIPTEEMARSYPVAPGNCVTFKIEGKPIVMEKSMGFSQLEAPRIDRYRLVREEDTQNEQNLPQNEPKNNSTENETIEELKGQIKAFKEELEDVKKRLHELEDVGA